MPFTPFHIGPSACLVLPFSKKLDVFVFIFVNAVIDLEPLWVLNTNVNYPVHGYAHSFLGAAVIGLLCGQVLYGCRKWIAFSMTRWVFLNYKPKYAGMLISGVLGAWFHVLLDSCIYTDIRPFFPLTGNFLFGLISARALYIFCAAAFLPAIIFYLGQTVGAKSNAIE